ncbi:MAG: ferritin-like domain-containing protein [Methylocystis sp.]|jgi:rubrerythrin
MSVDEKTIEALREALDDEYKARATYQSVIDKFGPVRPFVNIIEAEERHASALLRLFERFGVEPPNDRWSGQVPAPSSLAEACKAGVAAEIENAAMYERLLAQVSDARVREVLTRLQEASQQRHLPAFRRCAERPSGGARQMRRFAARGRCSG